MSFLRAGLLALGSGVLVSVATLFAACDSSGTIVPSADASTDVSEASAFFDGPTSFETGPSDGGSGDAAPASDAAAFGFIQFKQVPVGGGEFSAAFYGTPLPPPPGCTSELSDGGPCVVTTCPTHPPIDAGVVSLVSAGALTVTGGAFGDAGIEIGPDNLGSYLYNTTGPMFSPGDTLTVSGAGATVPAFPAQSIVAPGSITLTSPTPDSGTLVVQTAQDLRPHVDRWRRGRARHRRPERVLHERCFGVDAVPLGRYRGARDDTGQRARAARRGSSAGGGQRGGVVPAGRVVDLLGSLDGQRSLVRERREPRLLRVGGRGRFETPPGNTVTLRVTPSTRFGRRRSSKRLDFRACSRTGLGTIVAM